jgi:uncharacterized membrane protein YedE/YeeE
VAPDFDAGNGSLIGGDSGALSAILTTRGDTATLSITDETTDAVMRALIARTASACLGEGFGSALASGCEGTSTVHVTGAGAGVITAAFSAFVGSGMAAASTGFKSATGAD